MSDPAAEEMISFSVSPLGRAGAQRLRGQGRCREIKNTAIASLLQKLMLIAVQIFFGAELALSVTFGDTSPKGRGFAKPVGFAPLM